jgi:uncharacterized membrane protein (UPF0127 family)
MIKIKLQNEKLNLKAKKLSVIGKFIGLMFKSSKTKSLLFEFKKDKIISIHSYFVFFSFLAVWLDRDNNIIESQLVKPFTLLAKSNTLARKLIEIPLNKDNNDIIDLIVGKGKV